jgi:hypothetical protein
MVDAPLIFVLVIFVPARDIPDKSTFVSGAEASDTLGPTIYPVRMTYPVGSVAVVAFTSPPVIMRVSVAPVKFAFVSVAFVMIVSVKSTLERFALTRETPVPIIYPPRTTYPVGIMSAVDVPPVIPPLVTPVNVTRERFAPEMSHDARVAFVKIEPDKSAPVSGTPVISTAVKVAARTSTYGPRKYPLRATYPVGSDTLSAPEVEPDTSRVSVAPRRFAPAIEAPTRDCPLKSVFERLAPTSETPGPTIYPARITYPVGKMVVVAFDVTPPVMIPVRVVLVRFVPVISAFVRSALVRLEPDKSELTRDTPDRSIPVKFAFRMMREGPRKYP